MSELQEREIGANIFSMFVAITPLPGGKKSSRRNPFLKGMNPLPSIETKEGNPGMSFDNRNEPALEPLPILPAIWRSTRSKSPLIRDANEAKVPKQIMRKAGHSYGQEAEKFQSPKTRGRALWIPSVASDEDSDSSEYRDSPSSESDFKSPPPPINMKKPARSTESGIPRLISLKREVKPSKLPTLKPVPKTVRTRIENNRNCTDNRLTQRARRRQAKVVTVVHKEKVTLPAIRPMASRKIIELANDSQSERPGLDCFANQALTDARRNKPAGRRLSLAERNGQSSSRRR